MEKAMGNNFERTFKVIFRDFEKRNKPSAFLGEQEVKGEEFWAEILSEAIVPWGIEYYDNSISYRDNLSALSVGIFDDGFIEVKPGKIVSAACILQILETQGNEAQREPRSESRNESQQAQTNQKKDNRDGRENRDRNKFRKMRRFDKKQQPNSSQTEPKKTEDVPPKPEPPPNVLMKETQDLNEASTVGLAKGEP